MVWFRCWLSYSRSRYEEDQNDIFPVLINHMIKASFNLNDDLGAMFPNPVGLDFEI